MKLVNLIFFLLSSLAVGHNDSCVHLLLLFSPGAIPMKQSIDVRFSDLDPYQHVNSSRYLDFLNSAVWQWAQGQKISPAKTHAPVRMARLEMDFQRPITGTSQVLVYVTDSFVELGQPSFEFDILNSFETSRYLSGKLVLTTGAVNLRSSKIADDTLRTGTIKYEWPIDVRYNDLNIFNEVDLSQYLEYIVASRWHTVRDKFGLEPTDFLNLGIAFYMTRVEMDFFQPIKGGQRVVARSWVSNISSDKSQISVPFEITSADGQVIFSEGTLTMVIMDVSGKKPRRGPLPDWARSLFWETRENNRQD